MYIIVISETKDIFKYNVVPWSFLTISDNIHNTLNVINYRAVGHIVIVFFDKENIKIVKINKSDKR